MRKLSSINIVVVFYLLGCASLQANSSLNTNKVVVNPGKYSDNYDIQYTLTSDNFSLPMNGEGFSEEDGQFEIYINKNEFPIPSPNCKSKLILRMPSTISDDKNKTQSIDKKKWLYEEIKKVHDKKLSSLDVVIERAYPFLCV